MERVTIRVPEPQHEKVEQLVEAGVYPTMSEAYRSVMREEAEKYDFSGVEPVRKPPNVTITTSRSADSRARVGGLLETFRRRSDDDPPVLVFDEAGVTVGMSTPPGVQVVRSADEFAERVRAGK